MLDFNLGDFYPTENSDGDATGTRRSAARDRDMATSGFAPWLRGLARRLLRTDHRFGSSAA